MLHHAHFSAFQPVAGTPMGGERPTPATREVRLFRHGEPLTQAAFRTPVPPCAYR